MPVIIFSRNASTNSLKPFSLVRKVADIRMGFFTFRERWKLISGMDCRYPEEFSEEQVPADSIIIPENLLPSDLSVPNSASVHDHIKNAITVDKPWQVAQLNSKTIFFDFTLAIKNIKLPSLRATVKTLGTHPIYIHPSAKLEYCTINSSDGPVYISANSIIMDGSMLRGPLFIGEGTVVKMGATIYAGTTIGPSCVVGGEIKNSVVMGFSNKAHHGYLGDSVIGEWCNLGAGTTSSNMKNTAGTVKLWNIQEGIFESAGNKCGLIMGDFSRAAINTSFNTGTVTGICANIFDGQQLTPKFIPDFSWGVGGSVKYDLQKALNEIRTWMSLKGQTLSEEMIFRLTNIYQNQ